MVRESDRLTFRPITESDTENILIWRNNTNVLNHFIHRETLTKEEHLNWLKTRVATGEVIQFIIIKKDGSVPIGSVYLRYVDDTDKSAEFGIFIGHTGSCGKGLGLEATSFMIGYFFDEMKYKHLNLRVLEHNTPAINCYKKAGFTISDTPPEKVMINGTYETVIFMSITEEEYRRKKA